MNINKVLILGSGALKIGEAGEFDYSGSQAIKALKEEGIKTVLVNPNIATIQTSRLLADQVYFLPVTPFFVGKIIQKEKPDGIFLSFGGQTALNCGLELYRSGFLKKEGVKILGTPISAIELTEDREKFAKHLQKINIPTPKSIAVTSLKEILTVAKNIGFPVMIRSGYSLGGQGSGIAKNIQELEEMAKKSFSFAPQILVEEYLHHFKEIEYEVIRDTYDNCITVCNMENFDPMGIHTGESIVVAPSQTLTNFEYHSLRASAIKIVRSLGIVGECNVQFALNPKPKTRGVAQVEGSRERAVVRTSETRRALVGGNLRQDPMHTINYYVIEVNARLSRSSALASKATGYPLAYVAAKLALNKNLTSIKNKVTNVTQACFEPALDYIVTKIPRWDIQKFIGADDLIGSSMKSIGEVMGIGRTFEESLQKAIRMLDLDLQGVTDEKLIINGKPNSHLSSGNSYKTPTPYRIFRIAKAIKENISVDTIYKNTGINPWFLSRIKNIVDEEKKIINNYSSSEGEKRLSREVSTIDSSRLAHARSNNNLPVSQTILLKLKQLGFSDKRIGELIGLKGLEIRELRKKLGILPSVFQIDTLAGEFPAQTNYLYITYNGNHNDIKPSGKKAVVVLGSGPYRIGSSVEFDWTSVSTVQSLKKQSKESIIINCNPETVSTDYDISDKLYFEELTFERITDIYEFENPEGIIVSVGGQTPNNRAKALSQYGCNIMGTSPKDIQRAEDRTTFSKLLDTLSIAQPEWDKFTDLASVFRFAKKVGYPLLIRPSFVLSGTNMRVCHTKSEVEEFVKEISPISKDYPLTVSKFIDDARELEIDAVASKGTVKASVITEHIENAGVHSGDATIVLPQQTLSQKTQDSMTEIAQKLASSLKITGPFNIQFLLKNHAISVIEINLRASRTFPFISKVTGIDFIGLAVYAFFQNKKPRMMARQRPGLLRGGLPERKKFVAVKVPQFSFSRLTGADPILHVEMASTGEVACFGETVEEAFLKGELAVGGKIPTKGIFVSLGGEENKHDFLESVQMLQTLNVPLFATERTTIFLAKNGVKATKLYKIYEKESPNVLDYFQNGKIDLAINFIETHGTKDEKDEYTIRRAAIDHNIPIYTNLQKAKLFVNAITLYSIETLPVKSWSEYTI